MWPVVNVEETLANNCTNRVIETHILEKNKTHTCLDYKKVLTPS